MKRFVLVIILFLFPSAGWSMIIERIVAKVNEDIITLSELKEAKRAYSKVAGISVDDVPQDEILKMLIQRRLILQEARKKGIEVSKEEIDEALNQIRSSFKDEDSFKEELLAQGYTVEDLIEDYKEEILYSKLIDQEIRPRVRLTKEELETLDKEARYRLWKKRFGEALNEWVNDLYNKAYIEVIP